MIRMHIAIALTLATIILGVWTAIDPRPNESRLRAIETTLAITILFIIYGILTYNR